MSLLSKLDGFSSALKSELGGRKNGNSGGTKVMKHYFLCDAFTLAHELIVKYSNENLNKSDVIRRSIKCIYELAEEHGVVEKGKIKPLKLNNMYYIPLYDGSGNVSEDLHVDAIPVNESDDSRLKSRKKSRCEITQEENDMLITLKTIYKLQADGDMILHCLLVYASILSVEVEEGLHAFKGRRRGVAPVIQLKHRSPSLA